MFKKQLIIALLLIVTATCLLAADIDPLWAKAQKMAQADWDMVPGKVKLSISTSGAQSMSAEIHLSVKQTPEGLETEFIQGVLGGEEIDPADPMVGQMLQQDFTPQQEGIFFDDPADLKLKKAKGTKMVDGVDCVTFKYNKKVKTDDGNTSEIIGTMYLDSKTGEPVMDENTIFPLPDMFTKMSNTTYYKIDKKGHLISDRVYNESTIEFAGQKMETTTKSTMLNHFQYTPPSTEGMFEE
ncbi:MAG: hypothetical protein JXR56_05575 [Candidatus Cloacimonetes bacterium]|nr:hypothetical protein [Candidatus Cloacimonadota bacterium]